VPGAEILLVEDDDLNQAMVPAILARSDQPHLRDARVTVAGTLAQARAVLAGRRIDLVLLDMRLPDGSGLPLAAELRDQPGPSVAVIALTGAPAEHGDDARAAGCVAVLGKPYSLAELLKVVAAHLPRHEPGPDAPAGPAAAPQATAADIPRARAQESLADAPEAWAPAPAATGRQAEAQEPAAAIRQAGPLESPAELERARQAGQAAQDAKTEYVSRISHGLRTPINTILGFGELLCLGDLTAEHREWASMMVKAARHLASFIDDIADISRAEVHKLSVSIEPVPVRGVVADALDLMRPLSAAYGVHLDPPPPAIQHVFADPRRLRQVLLNLLSNAVKYNHPAGKVSVGIDAQPGDRLRICIRDTGRGIADYDMGRLFTPFQRLDAAQAGIEGAGLGLALSRQLIEAMGGTIGATSAPGEGSVFWVELPVAQPAATADAAAGPDPVVEQRAYTAPKTILYVEDMLESLLLVEHILKQRPSTSLVPAMLGGAALDLAAEYRPHLILLDLNLPDIPGEELLRRLKADPATSATPVVIISAVAERMDSLLAMGASAYLTKPISVRDFLHTLDALLAAPQPAAAAAGEEVAVLAAAEPAEPQPGPSQSDQA
jgi:signal transduction histidine kinase